MQIPKRELAIKGPYHHETVTTYVIRKSLRPVYIKSEKDNKSYAI